MIFAEVVFGGDGEIAAGASGAGDMVATRALGARFSGCG
jgi:hypothetical protein